MNNKPALTTETKLNNDGSIDVKVASKLKVTYVFKIVTAKKLKMPYAISINGVVSSKFKNLPQHINCDDGKIELYVSPGERVGLFLNSDAHPSYRRNLVYCIAPTNRDVVITIVEKRGKRSDTDQPVKVSTNESSDKKEKADSYTASLTGDIWMKISHRYMASEVETLLMGNFEELVAATVKKIYSNLEAPSLEINLPESDPKSTPRTIIVTMGDSANARDNIKDGYQFLTEGLTRVHPCGFAAIIDAAIKSGTGKIKMTSTWRPMMGSIAHRAGLGLDIDFIDSTRLNREELRGGPINTNNVSEEEKTLFTLLKAARTQEAEANKEVRSLRREIHKPGHSVEELNSMKRRLSELTQAAATTTEKRKDLEAAWVAEKDKNEPDEVRCFRQAILKSSSISQLFDPWVMDSNTSDNVSPLPNTQTDKNETLHAHHLHITVREPKIL